MKTKVDKLDIILLVNAPNSLDATKVDDLDIDKLQTFPVYLKKLSDEESQEVAKIRKFNRLNTKVNNLESKLPDSSTLI